MEEKDEKKFFVFQIIVTDLAAASSHYYKENTCHRQSMCQQTVLRLHTSLEETFSNSISPRAMKKYDESVVVQIHAVFETPLRVDCRGVFLNGQSITKYLKLTLVLT